MAGGGSVGFGEHLPILLTDSTNQYGGPGVYDRLITSAPQTGQDLRNRALGALLAQLGGPSFANLYAAGGADAAAQGLIAGRKRNQTQLNQRGLSTSGAGIATERGLLGEYGGRLGATTVGASDAETRRRLALLAQMLGIGQGDINFARTLGDAAAAVHGAANAQNLLDLSETAQIAQGAATVAATIAALGAGAAGGSAGGGAGAGGGAAAGAGGGGAAGSFGSAAPAGGAGGGGLASLGGGGGGAVYGGGGLSGGLAAGGGGGAFAAGSVYNPYGLPPWLAGGLTGYEVSQQQPKPQYSYYPAGFEAYA